jgi:hypothetical protein
MYALKPGFDPVPVPPSLLEIAPSPESYCQLSQSAESETDGSSTILKRAEGSYALLCAVNSVQVPALDSCQGAAVTIYRTKAKRFGEQVAQFFPETVEGKFTGILPSPD